MGRGGNSVSYRLRIVTALVTFLEDNTQHEACRVSATLGP